jgi:hypothetical protein
LEVVLEDARRLGVEPDEGVRACVVVLRAWSERIDLPETRPTDSAAVPFVSGSRRR